MFKWITNSKTKLDQLDSIKEEIDELKKEKESMKHDIKLLSNNLSQLQKGHRAVREKVHNVALAINNKRK